MLCQEPLGPPETAGGSRASVAGAKGRVPWSRTLLLGLCLLLVSGSLLADGDSPRELFTEALSALHGKDPARYEALKRQLRDYALYPYLEYEELLASLDTAIPDQVHGFVARYRGKVPLPEGLQRRWLQSLAAAGRWEDYLHEYHKGMGAVFDCHFAAAKLHTGREAEAWLLVESLWQVGKSQPPACDYPFQVWRDAGRMSTSEVLRRIGKAMYRDEIRLAVYLKRFIPPSQRGWVERWIALHDDPAGELERLVAEERSYWTPLLFRYGIVTLATRDAPAANLLWTQHADKYGYSRARRQRIERTITFNLAYQHEPEAFERLERLKGDPVAREWRLRLAIWHNRWRDVLSRIGALPGRERNDPEWVYWRARALEQLGKSVAAQKAYERAAPCHCYHGFLAAERLGTPHSMGSRPLKVSAERIARLRRQPAVVRIEELIALGRGEDARREWAWFARKLPPSQLDAAATLAHRYGWPDRVIYALGRSGRLSDLELRYPTPYPRTVEAAVARYGLDKPLVYALMRQESAFAPRARSRVGALGVMQLMPQTAKEAARRLGLPEPTPGGLLRPSENIRIGTAHLGELVQRYGGNRIYALAAYNAGHHRVMAWQPKEGAVPTDVWIANIPFAETREYVQRILVYTRIYSWRLGREWKLRSAFLGKMRPLTQLASAPELGPSQ